MNTRIDTSLLQTSLASMGALGACRTLGIANAHGNAKQARAVCPMCEGTEAFSMHVRDGRIVWACHSACTPKGGDVVTLFMRLRGVSFRTAIDELSAMAGATVVRADTPFSADYRQPENRPSLTAEQFHAFASYLLNWSVLNEKSDVAGYLERLGLLDASLQAVWGALPAIEHQTGLFFRLKAKFGSEAIKASGFFRCVKDAASARWQWHFAYPHHRVLIPWRTPNGMIQTLQMRCVGQPSGGTPKVVWPRGNGAQWPYGVNDVMPRIGDRTLPVEFVEGAKDTLAKRILLRRQNVSRLVVGLPSASASLRPEWLEWIRGRVVYVALDRDKAGQEAASRIAKQAHEAGASRVLWASPIAAKDWAERLENAR